MFKNLIKVALRNIRKDPGYSTINILGIAVGIASSLFILMYILDELRYDSFHVNKDNIYKVVTHISETDDEFVWTVAQIPFATQASMSSGRPTPITYLGLSWGSTDREASMASSIAPLPSPRLRPPSAYPSKPTSTRRRAQSSLSSG